MQKQPDFLTAQELVLRWNNAVTTGTLANWRAKGRGPSFQKFGSRVRYKLESVVAWEEQHHHDAANDNQQAAANAA